jgi:integration host factor subunit beta
MTKSELVAELASAHPHLAAHDIEKIVNILFRQIAETLAEGGRVELRGFGAFTVRERDARQGRNPRTGETVMVPAKRVPFFKAGKELREKINEKGRASSRRREGKEGREEKEEKTKGKRQRSGGTA